ncbi:hypothetical protein CLOM_g2457 [Closterium sp. NIES-68]|nr:hypothetical protein CLOM_g2457 [Closterium sp. NIES-68]GJP74355.1 hypothetical protein CLOP_g4949 [Closterium sp. NIES-67]
MAYPLIALLVASLAVQASAAAPKPADGCITNFDPTVNYFPDQYQDEPFALPISQTVVETANDFTVQYGSYYKVVKNSYDDTTYVLYQCGAVKPPNFPAATTRFFEIPLKGFAVDSTVAVSFVQMLGVTNLLNETSSYSVAPCVQKLVADGAAQVFNESDGLFPGAVFTGMTFQKPVPKNYVSLDTSTDPGPLKRAEWIKYMALWFNAESRASEVYSDIETSYNCLKASAPKTTTPVVGWLGYYMDSWTVSGAPYKLQYVADAGGVSPAKAYLRAYNMTDPADKKAFQSLLATLDIVIDETYLMTGPSGYSIDAFAKNAGISVTDTATYKFLATPNVWSMYGRATGAPNYATDWFESAIAQPQVVLAELISIMHPGDVTVPEKYYFYNVAQLEMGAVVSAANCTTLNPTEVVNPIIPACSATIVPETPGTASAPASPPSVGPTPPSSPPPSSPPPSSPPPAPKAAASSGSLIGAGLAALVAAAVAALV